MKVKELKKLIEHLDGDIEVEIEVVEREGHSIAYNIHGNYIDEMWDGEQQRDVQFLNLFHEVGKTTD